MSKFCGNCGALCDDSVKICGNCGAPFAEPETNSGNILSKIPNINNINLDNLKNINIKPEMKDQATKIAKIALPAVAGVVALLVIIFAIIVPNTGAQKAVKDYFKAFQKGESAKIVEYLPVSASAYLSEDENLMDMLDATLELSIDDLNGKYGEGFKFKVKKVEKEKLDEDDLDDIRDAYDEIADGLKAFNADSDFETPEIKAGYKFEFELVLKGDKREKTEDCEMTMIKENGKWVIYEMDTDMPGVGGILD